MDGKVNGINQGNADDNCDGFESFGGKVNGINQGNADDDNCDGFDSKVNGGNQGNPSADCDGTSNSGSREGPMAYIAFVIRNINTFNQFLSLVGQADITITDLTETHKPINLLPYMQSYDRSQVRLLVLSCK
jgi:hypothetical protein